MERICPLCNNLSNITIICPKCGNIMEDSGRVQEFRDSYAPEDEVEYDHNNCVHIFSCINCNITKNVGIKSVFM